MLEDIGFYEVATIINSYMDEGVIYHTKKCSFMRTVGSGEQRSSVDALDAITYFMEFEQIDGSVKIYFYELGSHKYERHSLVVDADAFDQEIMFSAFVSA